MKRITLLIVALVAMLAVATNVAAADWSSSVAKASVSPSDECAKVPSKAHFTPKSWSDGSSFKGSRGMLARTAPQPWKVVAHAKPVCGGGGVRACNQWVAIQGYGGIWYIWVPC